MKGRISIVNKIIALGLLATVAHAQTNHVVQPGETIDGISKIHKVPPDLIITANGIDNPTLIRPGQELKIPDPSAPPTPRTYEVKNGDTLGSIAIDFGTTVKEISILNQITDPKSLRAGQVLQIPASTTTASSAASAPKLTAEQRNPLPADVKRILDATPVKAGRWKYIVIHHTASSKGSLQSVEMYHRQKRKMENGMGYHFLIGNGLGMKDGEIGIGNRWKRQIKGGHLRSDRQNEVALGICLVGNFEVNKPTAAQMKSLYALTAYLIRRCGISRKNVTTHTEINIRPTACPGKLFSLQRVLDNI